MEQIDFLPFHGNPNLKKSNQPFEWTPELVQEYLKCAEDPIYFAETYMKIVNVDMGLIPIKLYDYQRDMILSMHENRNSIFATARQAGKCLDINTPISIRNKKTGEITKTTIGAFYESQKQRMSELQKDI